MNDMYTILINDNHSFTHSCKKKIMHRSTGIDSIRFLVNPRYGNLDMTKVNTVLEYVTPVSRTYGVVVLQPSAELYKSRVEYLLPLDLKLTSEPGDLELTINFSYLAMTRSGDFIEQVRPIGYTSICVEATKRWSDYIPSANLDNIAQIMMTNQSLVEELKAQAEIIAYDKADNIVVDEKTNEIYLTSGGQQIGRRVKSCDGHEDGIPVVDLDAAVGNEDDASEYNNVVEF